MKRLLPLLLATCSAVSMAAEPIRVQVTADPAATSTRVVLTLDREVPHQVLAGPDAVEVVFNDPVRPDPPSATRDEAILTGWRLDGERTLALAIGPGFHRYDVFELKNPARIVVDLQGERGGTGVFVGAPPPRPKRVVVIDPGHGGVEEGARGPTGLLEKNVVLDIARRLAALVERDGTTVVLTRDDDRLAPLDDRTAIANQNRAELFVSIHLNSAPMRSAFGAETYFLSPDSTDDEARTLAALENRAYAPDDESARPASGSGLELILWDLAQNRYLAESSRLAEEVQREMNILVGTRDRGVRQAPFTVLMGATMPAILVEVGFVSNPEEEAKLKDGAYLDRIAEALHRAIATFRSGPGGVR